MRILTWTYLILAAVTTVPQTGLAQPTGEAGPARRVLGGHPFQLDFVQETQEQMVVNAFLWRTLKNVVKESAF